MNKDIKQTIKIIQQELKTDFDIALFEYKESNIKALNIQKLKKDKINKIYSSDNFLDLLDLLNALYVIRLNTIFPINKYYSKKIDIMWFLDSIKSYPIEQKYISLFNILLKNELIYRNLWNKAKNISLHYGDTVETISNKYLTVKSLDVEEMNLI